MSVTTRFETIKAAKDYLVGKIVSEAERQGLSLSNAEREMLYWTEDDLLSPHMLQVAENLARECDTNAYEAKIGSLVRRLTPLPTPDEQDLWDDAVLKLCEGDHYLLVLIDRGAPPKQPLVPLPEGLRRWLPVFDQKSSRPTGDRLRLILAALILTLGAIAATFLFERR